MTVHKKNEFNKKFIKRKHFKYLKRKLKRLFKDENIIKHFVDTPTNLTLSENPIEVIVFFEKLKNLIQSLSEKSTKFCKDKYLIAINMKNVEFVNVDALMYLLLIKRKLKNNKINLKIIAPKNETLKRYLIYSGFVSDIEKDRERYFFPINSGNGENKSDVSRNICKFVQEKFELNKKHTLNLYNICIELMLNTIQHAFTSTYEYEKKWYIFADAKKVKDEIISFVFLDTGNGIPTTVNKRLKEKLKEKFTQTIDSELLFSALKGEYRSETKMPNRGKGLGEIYNLLKNNKIRDLKIISNKAYFNNENLNNLEKSFKGTLFYWEIHKEDLI